MRRDSGFRGHATEADHPRSTRSRHTSFPSAKPEKPSATAAIAAPARSLRALERLARDCEACPLHARATQTVFGEGPAHAPLVIVGEEPADVEDREGQPFVGPAGRLLDELLEQAGIVREKVWMTNAVKHFKWTPSPRGKRRLHARPSYGEIEACRGWLERGIRLIRPRMVLALGAVAAQSFMGRSFGLLAHRGEVLDTPFADWFMAPYHPAAVLRGPDPESRRRVRRALLKDLRSASEALSLL